MWTIWPNEPDGCAGPPDGRPYRMSAANRVLVLFAHPALEKSRVNRRLIRAAQGLEGVTFHDLYEAYPDFGAYEGVCMVEREQVAGKQAG